MIDLMDHNKSFRSSMTVSSHRVYFLITISKLLKILKLLYHIVISLKNISKKYMMLIKGTCVCLFKNDDMKTVINISADMSSTS